MPPPVCPMLPLATRQCALALVLLVAAGLRHHLVWGESPRLPFDLRPWLDAAETACVLGFAWFGWRGWLAAIAAVRERTPGLRALVHACLPLLLLAILVPPFLSADVADYVMRGRVLALHGGNPYVQLASDFAGDPFLAFGDAAWKQFPLPYGPLVAELQGALAWLGAQATFLPPRGQFVLTVGLFKLVFAAGLLVSALLARSLQARRRGDGDGDVAFVAVAWCPLLLNEALAQAHNESLLLLTILLALRAAVAGRTAAAAVALGLGVFTKIVPAAIGPLLLVFALRTRRLAPFLLGGLASAALLGFWWWRFFADPGALDFLRRQSGVTVASLAWAAPTWFGVDASCALWIGRVVALGVLACALRQVWRRPVGEQLVHGSAVVLATIACCGLAGFGPWYHVWWVPLALLGPAGFLRRFAAAIVLTAPACHVVWTSNRSLATGHQTVVLTMGIVMPALLALRRGSPARSDAVVPPR